MSTEVKTIIIAEIIITVLLVMLGGYIWFAKNKAETQRLVESPTPFITPPADGLLVIKTAPSDVNDVPTDQPIVIQFNKPPRVGDYIISISPDTPYTVAIDGTVVTLTPQGKWNEGTPYRYVVRYSDTKRASQGFDFTTRGKPIADLPDTRPDPTYIIGIEDWERTNHPDTYVVNKLPYQNDIFTISSDDTRGEDSHAYFIITAKGSQPEHEVQEAVHQWLTSLKLTDEQIKELDIRYTNP